MKKKLRIGSQVEGEDRLSSLSDDVIHLILSFLGIRLAVQTSVLSKRWKHIWTTLPFITFDGYDQLLPFTHSGIIKFMNHVLSNRNHQLNIYSFKFFALYPVPRSLMENVIEYSISHSVHDLDFDLQFQRHHSFKLSAFSSNSIQKLRLGVHLDFSKLWEPGGCWDLPVLETLHLVCPIFKSKYKVPLSCLICLPALTTLHLERCEFPELVPMILPGLTTLTMARCKLPRIIWDFPALLTLELDDVLFPHNMNELFSALVSLRNLTITFPKKFVQKYFIYCSQLVNLKISTSTSTCITPTRKIQVWAPKLCDICCVGIFQVRLLVNELKNANVKVLDTTEFHNLTLSRKKVFYHRLRRMFWQLGSAKILTIDSSTFEVTEYLSFVMLQSIFVVSNTYYVVSIRLFNITSVWLFK